MKIKHDDMLVDVLDPKCFDRPCYALGFEMGTMICSVLVD